MRLKKNQNCPTCKFFEDNPRHCALGNNNIMIEWFKNNEQISNRKTLREWFTTKEHIIVNLECWHAR